MDEKKKKPWFHKVTEKNIEENVKDQEEESRVEEEREEDSEPKMGID